VLREYAMAFLEVSISDWEVYPFVISVMSCAVRGVCVRCIRSVQANWDIFGFLEMGRSWGHCTSATSNATFTFFSCFRHEWIVVPAIGYYWGRLRTVKYCDGMMCILLFALRSKEVMLRLRQLVFVSWIWMECGDARNPASRIFVLSDLWGIHGGKDKLAPRLWFGCLVLLGWESDSTFVIVSWNEDIILFERQKLLGSALFDLMKS